MLSAVKQGVPYQGEILFEGTRVSSMKPEVRDFILETLKRVKLSGRGLSRVLRVARTIADLEAAPRIEVRHVAEAAGYREGEATSWMNG